MPNEKDPISAVRRLVWKSEGDKKYRTSERAKDPLREGRQVKVRRTNGQIEDGWKIKGFEEGGIIVEKKEIIRGKEEVLEKTVATLDLEALNPPKE